VNQLAGPQTHAVVDKEYVKYIKAPLSIWRRLMGYRKWRLRKVREAVVSEPKEDRRRSADTDRFVTVSSSGSVSVDLGGFLKSKAGQEQLDNMRVLRNFTNLEAASKRDIKKAG
jgi:hypothetical protein